MIRDKNQFDHFVCHQWQKLNDYLDNRFATTPALFYNSVDIRESKDKYAPVDNNIYPQGFNNICEKDFNHAVSWVQEYIYQKNPKISRIGLFPESHTKNLYYLENIYALKELFSAAGYEVELISSDPQLFNEGDSISLKSQRGHDLKISRCWTENHQLLTAEHKPFDLIILNNDQSSPLEINWSQLEVPVMPSPTLGWYQRSKAEHFKRYHDVVTQVAQEFNFDPYLICARHELVTGVDFAQKTGTEKLYQRAQEFFAQLPPDTKVFLKAAQGTYGMGISVLNSPEEILNMNRKKRNKMDVGKNNLKFTSVLLQEGIETMLRFDDAPAEVTIYLVGGRSIGGFLRTNPQRTSQENLNSRGMLYQKYCISEIAAGSDHKVKEAVYAFIARLSALASAQETYETSI